MKKQFGQCFDKRKKYFYLKTLSRDQKGNRNEVAKYYENFKNMLKTDLKYLMQGV